MSINYCLADVKYYIANGKVNPFIYNKSFTKIKNILEDKIIELDFSKHTHYEQALIDTIQQTTKTEDIQVFYTLFEPYYNFMYANNCESEIAREIRYLLSGKKVDFMVLRALVVDYAKRKIVNTEDLEELAIELSKQINYQEKLQRCLKENKTKLDKIQEESRLF
jgi:hypothetical protein